MFTLFFIAAAVAINAITSTEMQYKSQYQVQERNAGWNTAVFEKHYKSEPQPMVEHYDLNETQYLFFSQQVTWDEAQVLCNYYNAKLAILDTMEKATRIAESIADSNIELEEDSWLGGRRLGKTWSWMYDRVGSRKNSEIPVQPNIEDYPPWAREPSRPMKDCLAIDRREHSHPNFIDLDCRLQRPFICEKRAEEGVAKPISSKGVQIQRHTYTFYRAKFTWEEAAVYCRLLGARLAILSNSDVVEILANTMTKARPDPKDETSDWLNEPIKFTYNDSIYVIYPMEKTWQESNAFCNERGSVLAHMNDINITNLIVEAMGDHPKDISHIWIGGNLIKRNEWQWTQSGRRIANRKDTFGFPPWTSMNNEQLDRYTGRASTCLNLDRSDHVRPHFYGLDCDSKQPFVCKITCNVTPRVNNGSWICEDTSEDKRCELRCEDGFMTMGVRNVFCTHQRGWNTVKNWLEVPLCLVSRDYAKRMVRSLVHDLQSSAGYYFILDHANERMQSLSLRFAERILNIFPINYDLKMGMYCANLPAQLPFNQTDTCATLYTINTVAKKSNAVGDRRQMDSDILYKQLSVHKGRRVVIFIIIDVKHISRYVEILARMRTTGNRIVAIGLEDDWEILLALASIGFDRRKNLYLFDTTEFDTIINELQSFKKRTLKCPTRETDLISVHSEKNNNTAIQHNTASSELDQNQDNTKSQEQVSSENENSKDQGLESKEQPSSKDNNSTNDTLDTTTAKDEALENS